MRRLLYFLFFFLPVCSALAEDENTPSVPDYAITVTADRLIQEREDNTDSVEVITRQEIEQSQATTVLELLRDVAGLHIVQSGSPGKTAVAFLRGSNPAQVLVLLDGIEINDPFFGGVELANFLLDSVERIEILKGPQSPLYGSDAMAGVIHIVTRTPDNRLQYGGSFEAGGMSTWRESFHLSSGQSQFKYALELNRYDTAGQFANDEFNDTQANAKVFYDISNKTRVAFRTGYTDSHIGIPFSGNIARPDRNSDTTVGLTGLDLVSQINPGWSLKLSGSYVRQHFNFSDPEDLFSAKTENGSNNYKLSAQNDLILSSGSTLTFGLEVEHQNVDAFSNDNRILKETIVSRGVYMQEKLERGALLVSVGARVDHHNSFGYHFSPRVSIAARLSEKWKIRGGAGSAFRAPSAGELAYPFYGNPELKPESSRSFETGIDWMSDRARMSATVFHTRYDDLITFDPLTFIAENIERATTSGLEFSGSLPLLRNFRISPGYTFLQAKNENTGQPLVRRPKHSGNLTLYYDRPRWAWNLNFTAIGKRYETDFSTFTNRYNPGFLKADAGLSYRLGHNLKLAVRVENFLDQKYHEAFSFLAPGRTAYGAIHFVN